MELFTGSMWQIWAVVAVLCLIAEIFTAGFFVICFSFGALCALLSSFFCGVYVQIVIFAVASLLAMLLVRPMALKYLYGQRNECKTNTDALIGRKAVVCETIEADGYGRVKIGGEEWKAEAETGTFIAVGTRVEVIGRESVVVKVREI